MSDRRYLIVDVVKKHLNIDRDFTDDDGYISNLIMVAQNAVEIHTHRTLESMEDENGNLPPALLHAMLLLIGTMYGNRESVTYGSAKELPLGYQYLLDLFQSYSYYG